MLRYSLLTSTALVVGALLSTGVADDAKPMPGPRPVAGNLDNPSGVVIDPATGHYFVAEHRGVVRLFPQTDPAKKGLARKYEINKYPSDIYGKGPMYDIGPLGVALLNKDHLIVADGSRPDAQELVRIYKFGAEAPEKPAKEDSAAYTLGPIGPGDASEKGEGNFYGIAVTSDAIYVTCNGDDNKGWIARAVLTDGKPGKLEPFIATKSDVQTDAPCGITVNQKGDLVVGQMGEIATPGDSLLLIYDAKTGKLKNQYKTGLSDITGVAYSPVTQKLYATDFSWSDTTKGGLFELVIKGEECTARKVCDLDKPTSITFDAKGHAFVTTFGTAVEGDKLKPGKLVRIPKPAL